MNTTEGKESRKPPIDMKPIRREGCASDAAPRGWVGGSEPRALREARQQSGGRTLSASQFLPSPTHMPVRSWTQPHTARHVPAYEFNLRQPGDAHPSRLSGV